MLPKLKCSIFCFSSLKCYNTCFVLDIFMHSQNITVSNALRAVVSPSDKRANPSGGPNKCSPSHAECIYSLLKTVFRALKGSICALKVLCFQSIYMPQSQVSESWCLLQCFPDTSSVKECKSGPCVSERVWVMEADAEQTSEQAAASKVSADTITAQQWVFLKLTKHCTTIIVLKLSNLIPYL